MMISGTTGNSYAKRTNAKRRKTAYNQQEKQSGLTNGIIAAMKVKI